MPRGNSNSVNSDGRRYVRSYCEPCHREYGAERSRKFWEAHPELKEHRQLINRKAQFKKKYGITLDDYDAMLAAQEGRCAICGTDKPGPHNRKYLFVDHDHDTGAVRGLLCGNCNFAIGFLGDCPDRTQAAFEYLRKHKAV